MNVVVIGHICIDRNTSENNSYQTAGGPAVFINKILKQLRDVNISIISRYGKDFLEYEKSLPLIQEENLNDKTLVYENISKNGMRIQKAFNRESGNPPEIIGTKQEVLKKADIIFVAPLLPNFDYEYLKNALYHSKNDVLKALIPQGYFRNFDGENNVITRNFKEEEILSIFDLVIVSDQDGKDMIHTAKDWVVKYGVLVVITTGKDGAVAFTRNGQVNLPTKTVPEEDIVDTVGSGDIFTAAFAYKYHSTHSIEESGRFANDIARQCLFFTPDEIKIDL